jgi:hypothetical protein
MKESSPKVRTPVKLEHVDNVAMWHHLVLLIILVYYDGGKIEMDP